MSDFRKASTLFLLLTFVWFARSRAFSIASKAPSNRRHASTRLWAEEYVPIEGEGRINLKVRFVTSTSAI
jgi:hypothetical protein